MLDAMADDVPFPPELVAVVRAAYVLDWDGVHGWGHWLRVRENGLRLAAETGADRRVVTLFALFHDARRHDDGGDHGHGTRAAQLLESLPLAGLGLDEAARALLVFACRHHTEGLTEGDVTVQTCWDADRLDLGRVGTRPRADRLCTDAARRRETIEWAWRRSLAAD